MTTQQAAFEILQNEKKPLLASEIAKKILESGLKYSKAKNQINSLAQTIEKNIRESVYNEPKLKFIYSSKGRLVSLPEWNHKNAEESSVPILKKEIKFDINLELYEKIQLAHQAKISDSLENTIEILISSGLKSLANQIKDNLNKQLQKFNDLKMD